MTLELNPTSVTTRYFELSEQKKVNITKEVPENHNECDHDQAGGGGLFLHDCWLPVYVVSDKNLPLTGVESGISSWNLM